MEEKLELIKAEYLNTYTSECKVNWSDEFLKLKEKSNFTTEDFDYYLVTSSVYSSKIEGNSLDINSFFRNRENPTYHKRKEIKEIEDLTKSYKFASENVLNKKNVLKAHGILSKTLLSSNERGALRKVQVGVRDSATGKPVYMAVEPQYLNTEITKLFDDITGLLKRDLNYAEVFYYASMIHLWLAKIHPFTDGNGRVARLLEKWFIVSKLGIAGWTVRSEKYYWDHRPDYYKNIALGYNYYSLYWERCIPFLLMLPEALKESLQ